MNARPILSQLAGGLIIFAAACSDSPLGPSQLPSASSLSPQPPPSSASLVIEDFQVIAKFGGDGRFFLEGRFALRETGNRSGATVESFSLDYLGGRDWWEEFCIQRLRVPPGGVYDTLSTAEGYASWGYCAPYLGLFSGLIKEFPVILTVYFVDDEGHAGSTNAKAIWKY
jgi:hypothetical protein